MVKQLTQYKTGRFAIVGVGATAIDFILLLTLDTLTPLPVLAANVIATFTAFCFSFVANKKYTFRMSGTSVVREMALFTAFTLFGLWVLQSIVIHWVLPITSSLAESHEIALILAKLLATLVSLSWNYITYSRFVFVHKREEEQ